MKSKLKFTINNFLNELSMGESVSETNISPINKEKDIRLAEITRMNKYKRNSFEPTTDGKFVSIACWDSRATFNNLFYPIFQITLDKCNNKNVYLPETFNTFLNNLDFSKISDPSEFATISEKLGQLYKIRDLLRNAGKNKSEKYKKFRDGKIEEIYKIFTELGRYLKSYIDLPYAQNGVQVAMDLREDLNSYLRNLEEWYNERDERNKKLKKNPHLKVLIKK